MPYSSRHWLLTLKGDLFTSAGPTQEHFSMSLRLFGATTVVQPTQSEVDAFITSTSTMFGSTSLGIHNQHKLTGIKLAPIGTDGKYPPGEVARETAVLNVPGGYSATGSWVAQNTMALSLTTGVPRGRAHIGRIYLPPMGIAPGSDGLIASATVSANFLPPLRTWINAVNALFSDAKVFIASEFGDQHQVTGLRMGRVVDTQRRRRRSLPESPLSLAL